MFKKLVTAAVAGAVAVTIFTATPAQAHDAQGVDLGIRIHDSHKGWCASLTLPVSPAPGQPRSWQLFVDYCQPFHWAQRQREVDILTHGATYTHTYWDWDPSQTYLDPQGRRQTYSYVAKALGDGRATLNYDRIGNGNGGSTRPVNPAEITMASDAYVLHQLIRGLRFLGYKQINSVSHSYGSGVAAAEATTDYQDDIKASTVILTGYLHRPSNPAVTAGNYPANQDPKFAGLGLDGRYLTSRPGVRGTSFHSPTSDPEVVALDDENKDLVSLTGLLGFLGARNVPAAMNISNLITVPVLVVSGQLDAIFCYDPAVFDCANAATVTANEVPFYTQAPDFRVVMQPDSGHDLALHPSADDSYNTISGWIRSH
jgi:pimeloyl-ACP methyl ester carboxylesterase